MLDYHAVLTSLQTTLNGDATLAGYLQDSLGTGRVVIGPDFPVTPPSRFVMLAILTNDQEIDGGKMEYSLIGVTIAVAKVAVGKSADDYSIIRDVARRIVSLVDDIPSALALPYDRIAHISRTGGIPPSVFAIGSKDYLVSQERFELYSNSR